MVRIAGILAARLMPLQVPSQYGVLVCRRPYINESNNDESAEAGVSRSIKAIAIVGYLDNPN